MIIHRRFSQYVCICSKGGKSVKKHPVTIPNRCVSCFQSGGSNGTFLVAGLSNLFVCAFLGMVKAEEEEEEDAAVMAMMTVMTAETDKLSS